MRIFIIVEAHVESSTLPKHALLEVMEKPLLTYQLERLKKTDRPIIVATTADSEGALIASICEEMKVKSFKGDKQDVLGRYFEVADAAHADTIVRIKADSPLIDPKIIEKTIRYYLEHDNAYVSNTLKKSYPKGMEVEVFSIDLLYQAHHHAKHSCEREQVTPYIYTHFPTGHVISRTDNSHYNLAVDSEANFHLIKQVLEDLYPKNLDFTLEDILFYLSENPELEVLSKTYLKASVAEPLPL